MKSRSNTLTVIGLIVLLAGAVMTFTPLKEYANYVLVAGLLIMVIRGAFRSRERSEDRD